MKIHNTFYISLLEPWNANTFPSRQLPPPPSPEVINEEEHFEVQEILDSRFVRNKLKFLISWKGYDSSENSWVSADEFDHDDDSVLKFQQAHPTKATFSQN